MFLGKGLIIISFIEILKGNKENEKKILKKKVWKKLLSSNSISLWDVCRGQCQAVIIIIIIIITTATTTTIIIIINLAQGLGRYTSWEF